VKQVFTSPYRPSKNGQTERFNRTVIEFMCAYVSENQKDWDELVAIAKYAYNIKPHSSTGYTPFELVTSVPQDSFLAQMESTPDQSSVTKAEYRNEFLAKVSSFCKLARETLATQQERYRRAYDAHVRTTTRILTVGDLAYVKTYVSPKELSKKLIFPAVGPFLVSKVGFDRRTFKVQTPEGEVTVSADRLRKCPAPQDLPASM
jgi:hypothetical protein